MSEEPSLERAGQPTAPRPARATPALFGRAEARRMVQAYLEPLLPRTRFSGIDLAQLSRYLVTRSYQAGERIVKQGVRGDFLGLVVSGEVAVHSALVRSEHDALALDSLTALLLPGAVFGEPMLLEGRPSDSTLIAVSNVGIWMLRRADLLSLGASSGSPRFRASHHRRAPRLAWVPLAIAIVVLGCAVYLKWSGAFDRFPPAGAPGPTTGTEEEPTPLQIVSPAEGEAFHAAGPIQVRAVLAKAGFLEATLLADGKAQGVKLNPEPEASPWQVEWRWQPEQEGRHVLIVEARGQPGLLVASQTVTVTAVPAGRLAFASNRDGPYAVYVMDTDGRNPQRLTMGSAQLRRPAWRADGTLALVVESEATPARIALLEPENGRQTDLFPGRDPAWSPDGRRLAFVTGTTTVSQVYVALVGANRTARVTSEPVYAGQPTWSPDGQRLAYVVERNSQWDIWASGLDGRQPVRLTDHPAQDWAPAWSPDGDRIAFVSDRGGSHQIYLMGADGSGVVLLTDFPLGAESPAWSPDGNWLAFVAYTGDGAGVSAREIYLMQANGASQVRLTNNSFDDSQLAWGPGL